VLVSTARLPVIFADSAEIDPEVVKFPVITAPLDNVMGLVKVILAPAFRLSCAAFAAKMFAVIFVWAILLSF
jgi:hypothetical protein